MNILSKVIAISSLAKTLLIAMFFIASSRYTIVAQEFDFDTRMREYNMVDIQELDPEILVELKYSTVDNFVGKDMYGDFECAYLEKEFANRVVKAQRILKQRNPNYTLLIYERNFVLLRHQIIFLIPT